MAKILIIEDDLRFQRMLRQMLQQTGYEVLTASDGKVGMDVYCNEPTELVITDIIMPNKDGVETIFEFHRSFPDTKIIAISGGGRGKAEDYLESFGQAPNVKYTFQKPFVMDEMLQAVKELLG